MIQRRTLLQSMLAAAVLQAAMDEFYTSAARCKKPGRAPRLRYKTLSTGQLMTERCAGAYRNLLDG